MEFLARLPNCRLRTLYLAHKRVFKPERLTHSISLITNCQQLRSLIFDGYSFSINEELCYKIRALTALTELSLPRSLTSAQCYLVLNESLSYLNLKKLLLQLHPSNKDESFVDCNFQFWNSIVSRPSLQSLTVNWDMVDLGDKTLNKSNTHLSELKIEYRFEYFTSIPDILHSHPNLTTLHLQIGDTIPKEMCDAIGKLGNLRTLEIPFECRFYSDDLRFLARLTKLEKLNLQRCVVPITSIGSLASLQKLKTLLITFSEPDDDDDDPLEFKHLDLTFPALEHLEIRKLWDTRAYSIGFLSSLHNLKYVKLDHLTKQGTSSYLNLTHCHRLTV